MQEKHLFEYAVIRIVPRVEREEFINVGVVLYCSAQKFLQCKWDLDEGRLKAFSPVTDLDEIRKNLSAFSHITRGMEEGGIIARMDLASRFRWLTATRSTVLQTSKVHPGFCSDASKTLDKLYKELVLY